MEMKITYKNKACIVKEKCVFNSCGVISVVMRNPVNVVTTRLLLI